MNRVLGQRFAPALACVLLTFSAGPLFAAVEFYSFEGSLDGWVNVRTNSSDTPPKADSFQPFENVTPHSNDSNSPSTLDGTGASGVWQVVPDVSTFTAADCCYQDNQPETLVLTSPQFTLSASGSITFALTGGTGSQFARHGQFQHAAHRHQRQRFRGRGPAELTYCAYVLSATKPSVGESYVQLGFTNSQLAAAWVLGNGTLLQLDLINNFNGGWGWVAMDAVQINGVVTPEPASLLIWGVVIAGGLLVARRRKA